MLYASLWSRFELTTSVVIGTDCVGSCKSNYQAITATTAPVIRIEISANSSYFKLRFLTRAALRVPLWWIRNWLTFRSILIHPPFCEILCALVFLCNVLWINVCLLVLFLFDIVLSVFFPFRPSDNHFSIFKLFVSNTKWIKTILQIRIMSNISAHKIGIKFLKLFFAVMKCLSFFDLRILIKLL